MKTIKIFVLFFVLLIPFTAFSQDFSQDTISTHITKGCISSGFAESSVYFSRTADSISIYGKLVANCASSHIAIIRKTADTIIVTTQDTGSIMATCVCTYNFNIAIKAPLTDTLVMFNNVLYNLNIVANGLVDVTERSGLIDVIYDQTIECMRIRTSADIKIRMFTIYDSSGCQMLSMSNDRSQVDMSGFSSGLYILDFILTDNSHIIKKVIKH